jgi:hypothetical protein
MFSRHENAPQEFRPASANRANRGAVRGVCSEFDPRMGVAVGADRPLEARECFFGPAAMKQFRSFDEVIFLGPEETLKRTPAINFGQTSDGSGHVGHHHRVGLCVSRHRDNRGMAKAQGCRPPSGGNAKTLATPPSVGRRARAMGKVTAFSAQMNCITPAARPPNCQRTTGACFGLSLGGRDGCYSKGALARVCHNLKSQFGRQLPRLCGRILASGSGRPGYERWVF